MRRQRHAANSERVRLRQPDTVHRPQARRRNRLYDYRFRMYSPDLGRFCQTDPLGYIAAMSGGLPCDLPEGGRLEHAAGEGLRQTAENRVRKGRSGRFVPDFYDFTAPIDDPVCL